MTRVAYRLKQAWHHLYIGPNSIDLQVVKEVLPEAAIPLFSRMSKGDQVHACRVLATLRRSGPISPELSQAALLHDVGKAGAGLSLPYRTIIVILRWLAPDALDKLSQVASPAWRRPFYIQRQHAAVGARLCESAGCSPRVVQLVWHHDLPASQGVAMMQDVELAALCAADNTC